MSDTPRCDRHSLDMETEDFDAELAKTYELAWSLERELNAATNQLARICKEGFDNQDTIGLEPADDYVLRKLAELRQALSVRTVSCSNCNEMAKPCDWRQDWDGNWDTQCGQCVCFDYAPPKENGYKFCHSCGHPINFITFTYNDEQA